jgi:hypothetical protein
LKKTRISSQCEKVKSKDRKALLYQNKEKVVDSNIVPLVLTVEHLFLASTRPPGELSEDDIKQYNSLLKTEQKLISQGYNRILEKVKIVCQGFSKVVIAGTPSGKLVYDHYDTVRNIWGGSPNTVVLIT